ncbi:lipocalin/fatty-acid binding family protein [Streptomyces sp. NPDC051546]|uniref:lipocalin/fatty-acid binding family protein n=1 Tax=Streptomyces sp. NPDC051546 TaxID=3365655 RepID=UPI003796610F
MAVESGTWTMVSSDGYGDYLKAVGVGMIQRNLAEKATPTIELTGEGEAWTLKTLTPLRNHEVSFTLGAPVEHTGVEGRPAVSTFTIAGNRLIDIAIIDGDESTAQTVYTFDGAEVKATFSAKGVTATRVYKTTT